MKTGTLNSMMSPMSAANDKSSNSKQVDVYHIMAIDDVANYRRENKMKKDAKT
jgi:hypothetical protein